MAVDCGVKWQCSQYESKEALETLEKQIQIDKKLDEIRNTVFVTCFSETNCSFPMWGHYASEHKGLYLGYNLYRLIKKFNCMPVIYSDSLMVSGEKDIEKNLLASVLTKCFEWKDEKEWRIVKFDQDHKGDAGTVLENFLLPEEIYVGCKQTLTVKDNRCLRSQKVDVNLLYADINDIIDFASDNCIMAYLPILSKKEYKLRDRLILNP